MIELYVPRTRTFSTLRVVRDPARRAKDRMIPACFVKRYAAEANPHRQREIRSCSGTIPVCAPLSLAMEARTHTPGWATPTLMRVTSVAGTSSGTKKEPRGGGSGVRRGREVVTAGRVSAASAPILVIAPIDPPHSLPLHSPHYTHPPRAAGAFPTAFILAEQHDYLLLRRRLAPGWVRRVGR